MSPDGLLLQCSTLADVAPFAFSDGVQAPVARAYVEFAERLPLPEFRHVPRERITEPMRRDGFEVGNADGIFESTRIAAAAKAAAAEGGSARSGGGPGAGGKPGA